MTQAWTSGGAGVLTPSSSWRLTGDPCALQSRLVSDGRVRLDPAAVHWQAVDDELLMFDVRRGLYLEANRTAARLWPLLESGATPEQLSEQLVAETSIDRERARTDVLALIEWLQAQELLIVDG